MEIANGFAGAGSKITMAGKAAGECFVALVRDHVQQKISKLQLDGNNVLRLRLSFL